MNINTLIVNIRNAIHDNAALQSWCTTNYSRAHKVYVGIDTRKPPIDDQYPIVHLFPLSKTIGGGNQNHAIGVTCGLYDDDVRTVTGKANVVELEGVQNMESFRKLVETALLTAPLDNGHWVDAIDITFETIEFFPYFLCAMEVSIRAELGFDSDPFE